MLQSNYCNLLQAMCICLLADDLCYLFNKLSPRWKGAEVKGQMSLILHCPSEDTQGGLEGSGWEMQALESDNFGFI